MTEHYMIKATALFPIHVGGGPAALLDPLEYVVHEGRFYRLDVEGMFTTDKAFAGRFADLTDRNNMRGLRDLVARAFEPDDARHYRWSAAVSSGFEQTYRQKRDDMRNQLLVQCLPRAGSRAYIPGSSLKGAIRTAVLDRRAAARGYQSIAQQIDRDKPRQMAQMAEALSLNAQSGRSGQIKPESDPFKGVKVGDALLPGDTTRIVEVRNVAAQNKALSLDMFVESIIPGTMITADLSVTPHGGAGMKMVKKPVTAHEIIEATVEYYQEALKNEEEKFYTGRKASDWIDKVFDINEEDNTESKTVVRVGRFSHLESMTFNDKALRRPRPPRDPRTGRPKASGTTRNLVDGFVPLGALKLELVER